MVDATVVHADICARRRHRQLSKVPAASRWTSSADAWIVSPPRTKWPRAISRCAAAVADCKWPCRPPSSSSSAGTMDRRVRPRADTLHSPPPPAPAGSPRRPWSLGPLMVSIYYDHGYCSLILQCRWFNHSFSYWLSILVWQYAYWDLMCLKYVHVSYWWKCLN